ncbi:hypothetical protein JOQ06_014995 [Pogonophryne albipinna]|uniref:Uncharacterized protein n=1 Tax=Pogonophryne albipinna TaxID=1090488 RepID=A0AAD6AM52_9TELE|nr:hypothetical protein JOQ06_014995 [Pogonophryne albipinna]
MPESRRTDNHSERIRMLPIICSSSAPSLQFPAETERGQRLPDVDAAQQLKLRERQRFFEEVFQHDADVYLSSAHLCIRDFKRPPIGSISSMEVNMDMMDQMELIDVSDQEALDVFFSSSGEEGSMTSPLPGHLDVNAATVYHLVVCVSQAPSSGQQMTLAAVPPPAAEASQSIVTSLPFPKHSISVF